MAISESLAMCRIGAKSSCLCSSNVISWSLDSSEGTVGYITALGVVSFSLLLLLERPYSLKKGLVGEEIVDGCKRGVGKWGVVASELESWNISSASVASAQRLRAASMDFASFRGPTLANISTTRLGRLGFTHG